VCCAQPTQLIFYSINELKIENSSKGKDRKGFLPKSESERLPLHREVLGAAGSENQVSPHSRDLGRLLLFSLGSCFWAGPCCFQSLSEAALQGFDGPGFKTVIVPIFLRICDY
jgi:hypothetical protein